jgi:hypothetical protein
MQTLARLLRFSSLTLLVLLIAAACTKDAPQAPTPTAPTQAPTAPAPTATPAPTPTPSVSDLAATVQAKLPTGAFEGVKVVPLNAPAGARPVWAVYSFGMRNFDTNPLPDHFIAIFAQEAGAWKELARQPFSADDVTVAAPDYLGEDALTQVQIEKSRIWLQMEGGVGAHSGVFNLLSFDGSQLKVELNAFAPSPGVGHVQDVNGDKQLDVVIDASDRYVFCYACGVAKIAFVVYTWDAQDKRLVEIPLQDMLMGQSGHPGRNASNQAVLLARGGLWKAALAQIAEARKLAADVKPPLSNEAINWNYGLIKLHADALAAHALDSGYPLLTQVFYGDYAAAVDLMRPYRPEQLFTAATPLVAGTVAETWIPQLSGNITTSATSALLVQPDLAAAYFLRGWAEYLEDPVKRLPQAKSDVAKAASLTPNDTLFKQAAAFLTKPVPTPRAPTPKPIPTPASQAKRISFAAGATSAEVQGQIAAGKIDEYVLKASQGQWLTVSIFSPRNDVLLAVTGLSDGQPYLRSAAGAATWQGKLPATQDYSLKAVSSGAASPYTLQVTIPARITFQPGTTGTTVDGRLTAQGQNEYTLRALKGQRMTVTIASPRNDVLLEIYGLEDGQPLVRVPMGAKTWTGVLPGTQDYSIKAVTTGGPTTYKLYVTIR